MHIIEQIGSYAGLAAIPGLAVLSALYFSQARDVRRLREWAGRAPERAAEQAVGGRVQVLPGQAAGATGAQPGAAQPAAAEQAAAAAGATPAVAAAGAATAPAAAAAAGAKPAVAAGPKPAAAAAAPATATAEGDATPGTGEPATPAGRAAAALGDAEKAASGDGATPENAAAGANGAGAPAEAGEPGDDAKPAAKPGALTPAAVASAAASAKGAARPGATGARPGPPAVGGVARPAATTTARRHIPSLPHSSRTSVLGKGARPVDPWYRRFAARLPAGRYVALIVAGALVLGGGAAFAISQIGGSDDNGSSASKTPSGSPANPGSDSSANKDKNVKATPAVDPSKITVTVVNGTTIPNLARDTAAKLQQQGFQIGNKVTGTGSLAVAESLVEYRPGAEEAARLVAAKLGISQKQPADPDALAQAGPAQVIAVLGADQGPGG